MLEVFDEVTTKTVDLSGTMLEALEFVERTADGGDETLTISVFRDFVEALNRVEETLNFISTYAQIDTCKQKFKVLCASVEHVVKNLEQAKYDKIPSLLKFTVIPNFKKWRMEFERVASNLVVH